MGMPIREIAMQERLAKSREEHTKAINSNKGKEFAKETGRLLAERKLLEKARGGAKTLDLAEEHYKARVDEGRLEAAKMIRAAEDEIKAIKAELEEERRVFGNHRAQVDSQGKAQKVKSMEIDEANRALKVREKAAAAIDEDLAARKADVASRETQVTAREAENKRKDDYYAGAPS